MLVRLSGFLATQACSPELRTLVERATQQVGAMREGARRLRGDARDETAKRLAALDQELMEGALRSAPDALAAEAHAAAVAELAAFRERMSDDAYDNAIRRLTAREIRSRLQLPTLAVD